MRTITVTLTIPETQDEAKAHTREARDQMEADGWTEGERLPDDALGFGTRAMWVALQDIKDGGDVRFDSLALFAASYADTLRRRHPDGPAPQDGTEWRAVPGRDPRYEVSRDGQVRSWKPWHSRPVPRILAGSINSAGHHVVQFGRNKPRERVADLVALAFRDEILADGPPELTEAEIEHGRAIAKRLNAGNEN